MVHISGACLLISLYHLGFDNPFFNVFECLKERLSLNETSILDINGVEVLFLIPSSLSLRIHLCLSKSVTAENSSCMSYIKECETLCKVQVS